MTKNGGGGLRTEETNDSFLGNTGFSVSPPTLAIPTLDRPLREDRHRVIFLFICFILFLISHLAECLLHKRPSVNIERASKLIKLSFKLLG